MSTIDNRCKFYNLSFFTFADVTDDQFLLVGFSDGLFAVCTDPEARYRMLHTAMLKNPLMGSVV